MCLDLLVAEMDLFSCRYFIWRDGLPSCKAVPSIMPYTKFPSPTEAVFCLGHHTNSMSVFRERNLVSYLLWKEIEFVFKRSYM